MKPFMSVDVTENSKNDVFNGEEFCVAKASEATKRALEASGDEAEKLLKNAQLPLPLRIIQWICGAVGGVTALGIVDAAFEGTNLVQGYKNAPALFWIAGGCLAAWLLLKLLGHGQAKKVLEGEEGTRVTNRAESLAQSAYLELGVPRDAPMMDILSFKYKVKKGEPVAVASGLGGIIYINLEAKVFVKDGMLYLASLEEKYAFALSELRSIQTINKRICVLTWNKDTAFNQLPYSAYSIQENDGGDISVKPYHILELEHAGEIYGIYFPCYELPTIQELTGLTAQ